MIITSKLLFLYNNVDFFSNKKVAFIGPAAYSLTQKNGSFIDSHDIVVRLIKSLPLDPAHYECLGKKTNVVAASCIGDRGLFSDKAVAALTLNELCPKQIQQVRNNGGKLLIPTEKNYTTHTENTIKLLTAQAPDINIYYQSDKFIHNINKKLNTHLTTGMATICSLLNTKLKSLYLFGFTLDCKISPRIKNYESRCLDKSTVDLSGWHKVEVEKKYMSDLLKKDKRIIIDDYMRKVLSGY